MVGHRPRRRSSLRLPTALAAALVAVVALIGACAPARAAAGDITWAVGPATDGAPDKRSWVELTLDPGQSVQEQAAVRNLSDQTVTFRVTAADGYFTDKGRFNMLPATRESVDAGTWITAQESVTVDPGGIGIVPFVVSVPDNATPGDHAAGIAASVVSAGADAGGSAVGVESRIGFRVMTRVTGEIAPSAMLESVTSDYRMSWNPFRPGSLSVRAHVVNTGNVRLLVDGSASAQGATVPLVPADGGPQELLPGDRRTVVVELDDIWPLFAVGADLSLAPTAVTLDGRPVDVPTTRVSTTVAALPIAQLAVAMGVLLLVFAVLVGRARARRRFARLLRQAKEEGLREGAERGSDEGARSGDRDL